MTAPDEHGNAAPVTAPSASVPDGPPAPGTTATAVVDPADDTELHLDDEELDDQPGSDWAWVEEWRLSDEPPAWGPGVAIGVFAMLIVASAVFVLSVGLGDMPWLALAANLVVAIGLAPALWLCRSLPVLRFLAWGAAVGIVVGWIAALMN
jgi:hypothetical protein